MLTNEQRRKITTSIAETERVLARAMKYSPQFRDAKLIADYSAHLDRLRSTLANADGLTFSVERGTFVADAEVAASDAARGYSYPAAWVQA